MDNTNIDHFEYSSEEPASSIENHSQLEGRRDVLVERVEDFSSEIDSEKQNLLARTEATRNEGGQVENGFDRRNVDDVQSLNFTEEFTTVDELLDFLSKLSADELKNLTDNQRWYIIGAIDSIDENERPDLKGVKQRYEPILNLLDTSDDEQPVNIDEQETAERERHTQVSFALRKDKAGENIDSYIADSDEFDTDQEKEEFRDSVTEVKFVRRGDELINDPEANREEGDRQMSVTEYVSIRLKEISELPESRQEQEKLALEQEVFNLLRQDNPNVTLEQVKELMTNVENDPNFYLDAVQGLQLTEIVLSGSKEDAEEALKLFESGNRQAFQEFAVQVAERTGNAELAALTQEGETALESVRQYEIEQAARAYGEMPSFTSLSAQTQATLGRLSESSANPDFAQDFVSGIMLETADGVYSKMDNPDADQYGLVVFIPHEGTLQASMGAEPLSTMNYDKFDDAAAMQLRRYAGVGALGTDAQMESFLEAGDIDPDDNQMMNPEQVKYVLAMFDAIGLDTDKDTGFAWLEDLHLLSSDGSMNSTNLTRLFTALEIWGVRENSAGVTRDDVQRLTGYWENTGQQDLPALATVRSWSPDMYQQKPDVV